MPRIELNFLFALAIGLLAFASGAISDLEASRRFELCATRRIADSPSFSDEDLLRLSKIEEEIESRMQMQQLAPGTMIRLYVESLRDLVDSDDDMPLVRQRREEALSALELCSPSLVKSIDSETAEEIIRVFSSLRNEKSMYVSTEHKEKPASSKNRKESPGDVKVRAKRSPIDFSSRVNFRSGRRQQETLQTAISRALLNSQVFVDTFNTATSREDAIKYSRGMVESGVSSYGNFIVDEALQTVTNSISIMGMFPNSNNYAFVISKSIFDTLRSHELHYFAEGNSVANLMISKLQEMLDNESFQLPESSVFDQSQASSSFGQIAADSVWNPPAAPPPGNIGGVGSAQFASSGWGSPAPAPLPFEQSQFQSTFQSPPQNPSAYSSIPGAPSELALQPPNVWQPETQGVFFNQPTVIGQGSSSSDSQVSSALSNPPPENEEMSFQDLLEIFLAGSDKIASLFCNGPAEGVFRMVNLGLADFGAQPSFQAADTCNKAISQTPPNLACDQYSKILSKIITDTLREYGLLENANAYRISNKMAASIGPPRDALPLPPQNPDIFRDDVQLQPSFYSEFQPEGIPAVETPEYPSSIPSNTAPASAIIETPDIQPSFPETSLGAPILPDVNPPTVVDTPLNADFQSPADIDSSPVVVEEVRNQQVAGNVDSESYSTGSSDARISTSSAGDVTETSSQKTVEVDTVSSKNIKLLRDAYSEFVLSKSRKDNPASLSTENVDSSTVMTSDKTQSTSGQPETTTECVDESTSGDGSSSSQTTNTQGTLTSAFSTSTEPTTTDSYVRDRADAVQDPKKLSKLLLAEMDSSMKAVGSDEETANKQQQAQESGSQDSGSQAAEDQDISMLLDMLFSISDSSIGFIHSADYNFPGLCSKLNALASLVDIPPVVDNCSEIALVDYLLHILREVAVIFRNA